MKVTESSQPLLLKGGNIYDPVAGAYRREDILIENGKIKARKRLTVLKDMVLLIVLLVIFSPFLYTFPAISPF